MSAPPTCCNEISVINSLPFINLHGLVKIVFGALALFSNTTASGSYIASSNEVSSSPVRGERSSNESLRGRFKPRDCAGVWNFENVFGRGDRDREFAHGSERRPIVAFLLPRSELCGEVFAPHDFDDDDDDLDLCERSVPRFENDSRFALPHPAFSGAFEPHAVEDEDLAEDDDCERPPPPRNEDDPAPHPDPFETVDPHESDVDVGGNDEAPLVDGWP